MLEWSTLSFSWMLFCCLFLHFFELKSFLISHVGILFLLMPRLFSNDCHLSIKKQGLILKAYTQARHLHVFGPWSSTGYIQCCIKSLVCLQKGTQFPLPLSLYISAIEGHDFAMCSYVTPKVCLNFNIWNRLYSDPTVPVLSCSLVWHHNCTVSRCGEHVGNITSSNTKLSHGSPTLSIRCQQGNGKRFQGNWRVCMLLPYCHRASQICWYLSNICPLLGEEGRRPPKTLPTGSSIHPSKKICLKLWICSHLCLSSAPVTNKWEEESLKFPKH